MDLLSWIFLIIFCWGFSWKLSSLIFWGTSRQYIEIYYKKININWKLFLFYIFFLHMNFLFIFLSFIFHFLQNCIKKKMKIKTLVSKIIRFTFHSCHRFPLASCWYPCQFSFHSFNFHSLNLLLDIVSTRLEWKIIKQFSFNLSTQWWQHKQV